MKQLNERFIYDLRMMPKYMYFFFYRRRIIEKDGNHFEQTKIRRYILV